ncbi:MAG: hypothetical protein ACM3MG_12195 [Bacillota bacterium]
MSKKTKPAWAQQGHAKPVSRRDFLAAGLLPFAANIFIPNWVSLLVGTNAEGATPTCPVPGSLIPFVTVNLAGGAAMASNWVPMNSAGEPLSSYNTMGLGDNQLPIEKEFGNATFAGGGISKILAGIRQTATTTTIAKTTFIGIPVESTSDSSFNSFDISGAVTKAGLIGTALGNLGSFATNTGIRQLSALMAPPSPLVVTTYQDIVNSVSYTASIGSRLSKNQKLSLVKLMNNLTASQAKKIADVSGGPAVESVLDCAGIKNVSTMSLSSDIFSPISNAGVAKIWGVTTATAVNAPEKTFSSMIYCSLMGYAGTCNLELGGYDYHDNTRTTGDDKDLEAGNLLGRIIESAAVLGKPVMIYVVSDGAVFSPTSSDRSAPWSGDQSGTGAAYLLYFNPNGRPAVSGNQIGYFTNNQVSDVSTLTGGSPRNTGIAVLANYLQANKRIDLFNSLAGGLIDSTQLNSILRIA